MHYHSLLGPLEVTRATYRQAGVRNGPTVVPLELIAGLAESTTPALAFSIALGYSRSDMREHLDNLEAAHRMRRQGLRLSESQRCSLRRFIVKLSVLRINSVEWKNYLKERTPSVLVSSGPRYRWLS